MTYKEMIQVINVLSKIDNNQKRELAMDSLLNYCDVSDMVLIDIVVSIKRFLHI